MNRDPQATPDTLFRTVEPGLDDRPAGTLWRRKRLLLLGLADRRCAGLAYYFFLPPTYESIANVLLVPKATRSRHGQSAVRIELRGLCRHTPGADHQPPDY